MNVRIDSSSGFCWGVVRSVNIAEGTLKNNNNEKKNLCLRFYNP